ncbi:MAG: DNA replication protein DnaC [Ulvibacter sp.]|jgi:DNA replication protein DnaC
MAIKMFLKDLRELKLDAMADEYCALKKQPLFDELTPDEVIKHMVQAQKNVVTEKRVNLLVRKSQLPYLQADKNSIDYSIHRGLNREYWLRLLRCEWINEQHNLVLTGPEHTGKTWLASAMGLAAANQQLSTIYYSLHDLINKNYQANLKAKNGDLKAQTALKKELEKIDLLVIDNFGLYQHDIDDIEVLEKICHIRLELKKSMLIISPIHPDEWKQSFNTTSAAASLIKKLTQGSYLIPLKTPPEKKSPYKQIIE